MRVSSEIVQHVKRCRGRKKKEEVEERQSMTIPKIAFRSCLLFLHSFLLGGQESILTRSLSFFDSIYFLCPACRRQEEKRRTGKKRSHFFLHLSFLTLNHSLIDSMSKRFFSFRFLLVYLLLLLLIARLVCCTRCSFFAHSLKQSLSHKVDQGKTILSLTHRLSFLVIGFASTVCLQLHAAAVSAKGKKLGGPVMHKTLMKGVQQGHR